MSPIREQSLRISRTARFAVCGDPATAPEAWFVLHGYRQLAGRFIQRFADLPGVSDGRRAVIAPEALNRFYIEREPAGPHGPDARVGATWMTRHDRDAEIRDYVDYLDRLREHTGGPADRLVVLGFSQGAETASRWAVLGGSPPDELILWGGGLAADLDEERAAAVLARTTVSFVVGDTDRWAIQRSASGLALLGRLGVPVRKIEYSGGHRVEPDVLAAHWP